MQVTPRMRTDWKGRPKPDIIPSSEGVWVECEVTNPPSRKGKTVHVFFPPDTVTEMLLTFRNAARDMRQ